MKPPATATTPEQPPLDNIQILLQRRAELAKNKAKYSLTETDAQLLSTHSTEVQFAAGQTIIEEYQDIDAVYRIKSGKVIVSRNGYQFNIIGKGWYIGDPMFIYDTPAYAVKVTMKAEGSVVLEQLNLPFIKQLFTIDCTLHAKVMRHLVAKYSFMFEQLINNLDSPYARYKTISNDHLSSSSSLSSPSLSSSSSPLSSLSSSSSTSSSDLNPETAKILTAELSNTEELDLSSDSVSVSSLSSSSSSSFSPIPSPQGSRERPPSKRELRVRENAAYKSYPLAARGGGIQTLQLKGKKLTVVAKSFGFSFKTTIEYSKILSIAKVGETAVTIVYNPRKVANVFFKKYYDREEFLGLVNSLISNTVQSPEVSKRHSGQSLTVPHNPELSYDEVPLCGGKGECCQTISTTQQYKRGETVFEEGDLFQRVYTLTKGHCEIFQKGNKICTMEEGDIFGVGTLLHLRPIPVTLKAGSESVELMMVPAYKLNALIDTDAARAASIYREAARALDRKISQAMGYLPNYKRIFREAREKKREGEVSEQEIVA